MAAPRLIAATIAGLVLSVWAIAVGTVVGWQVAQSMLGVSTDSFFQMFWDMLWLRDVVGLIIKGLLFGLLAALFSCHEGLRRPRPTRVSTRFRPPQCRSLLRGRGDPDHQQRLVHPCLSLRPGVRSDADGPPILLIGSDLNVNHIEVLSGLTDALGEEPR